MVLVDSSLELPRVARLPGHIGIIPDGNRRWAVARNLPKAAGYEFGLKPGIQMYELCYALGVKELTFYGFTQDNTKRPSDQKRAFQKACVDAAEILTTRDAALLVIGDASSPLFPAELKPYTTRTVFGKGLIRVNLLVNYSWRWDLAHASANGSGAKRNSVESHLASSDVSRIDLMIRWGGRQRLSGFLPVQSVYADFYFIDALWPDFQPEQFFQALRWFDRQDVTLGG
jgi:undecaprenyl diphosphate synthase